MDHHDENFRDTSSYGWIAINLVAMVWVTMPVSIVAMQIMQR
ncbi:hypothetical protein [Neptunomonas japonica]|uniref:Uncharacterized protein n=1 Tax=Neptunomonas japonica JAMM 1380 TaxID=1441457 RepID=A0A7R6SY70_9GAMM|nr:hypothetical protein [Neptunomonas japonica]BBB31427.1 conserved hypothetical protein [Neptunomonas japonica JAMM 1380]